MEILGWMIFLIIAAPLLSKFVPPIIQGIEEGIAEGKQRRIRKEIANLPPAERLMVEQHMINTRPYRETPMFTPQVVKKGGGLGKFIVIALCIGYIIFPIDLIPDVIPVLGWGDDVVAGLIGLRTLFK